DELIAKVKAAADIPTSRLPAIETVAPPKLRPTIAHKNSVDIVVIGISTGGPQALRYVIPQLPADFSVPVAIVMHMPVGYTEMYANKLNELTNLDFHEAKEGELVERGNVLLAPAGRHLTFRRDKDQ